MEAKDAARHLTVHRAAPNVNSGQVERPWGGVIISLSTPNSANQLVLCAKHCASARDKMGVKQGRQAAWFTIARFGGPHRVLESPLPRWGGGGEDRSSPRRASGIKKPGVASPWRSHHPNLLPGRALTRRCSCLVPELMCPRASVSPPGQRAAARSNLLGGHRRIRQPAKAALSPRGASVSTPRATPTRQHRGKKRAPQGRTEAKAPEEKWSRPQQ